MTWELAVLVYGVMLFSLLLFGVSIGSVMGIVGVGAVTLVSGTQLWPTFGDIVWNTMDSFTLVAVPLFVLMGEIVLRSGVSERFYAGLARLLKDVRGGLAHSNIAGCAMFAAISGSSTATALTVGTVALPEMRRRGYDDELTLGSLAGGGCLGILIPPSIPMIIYASVVQVSVVDLFMAGIIPGLVLAGLFSTYIAIRLWFRSDLVVTVGSAPLISVWRALADSVPLVALIFLILGGLYFGMVTPTEAAGAGCLGALLLGLLYGRLTWEGMREALRRAIITNSVVMFVILNSQILSFALSTSGVGREVSGFIAALDLAPVLFFGVLVLLFLVLGAFIDGISMMLLTIPLLYPSLVAAGFDGVLFGVLIMLFIELGQLTPPMGLNLFAVQSISGGVPLGRIAKASAPYAAIIVLLSFVLFMFPQLALWLPATMKG